MRTDHRRRHALWALPTAVAAVGAALVVATALPTGAATTPTAGGSGAATTPTAGGSRAATTSAGCGKAPTLKSGTYSLQSGGTNRTYILKMPDNYDSNHAYRLVFGLHWLGGTANDVANGGTIEPYYGLQRRSNGSAIFVAPQGIDNGWPNTNGRDVTFVDDMIKTIEADLCVDTTQRFSLGFSYGAGMSYALACARPTVFRAVALYAGGLISGCTGGTSPVALLQAHGISDNVLAISGARTMRDRFVKNNGCTTASPPEPASGSRTHTSFAYSGCTPGYPVEWYAFDGGHTPVPPDGNSWLPDATWRFFSQFQSGSTDTAPTPVSTSSPLPSSGSTSVTIPVTRPTAPVFTLPVSRVSAQQ